MSTHPVERFDPLLRNLLAWNLVERVDDEGWVLRAEAVDRLDALAKITRSSDPTEIVYFGHTCSGCRSNGLTRLRDGQYLCDECRRVADLAVVATLVPAPQAEKPRRFMRSRKIAS